VYFFVPVMSAGFRSTVAHRDGRHCLPVSDHQGRIGGKFVRSIHRDVAIASQQVKGTAARIEQHTCLHGLERMQTEFQRRDNTKIAASPANGPEQIFILRSAHIDVSAVGADQIDGDYIVAAQSMLAHQPTDAATECQSADSC